ncbi:MAG TPA: hypothetical protein VGK10_01485 [Prolixibacteraceae bacterium]|jgi:hypothetical protein
METTELRKSIVQRVLLTDDQPLLNHLHLYLNNNHHQESHLSSEVDKSQVSDSHAAYLAGIPNEVLFYQQVNWISE